MNIMNPFAPLVLKNVLFTPLKEYYQDVINIQSIWKLNIIVYQVIHFWAKNFDKKNFSSNIEQYDKCL